MTPVATTDFPVTGRRLDGRRVIYLDSAATTLKPTPVIDAVLRFYRESTSNVHRGQHALGQEASEAYEAARHAVADFIGASGRGIVFTANATAAINLVADGIGLAAGDNVVTSVFEHHSNLLPWMRRTEVRLAGATPDGALDIAALERLIDARTRLVAIGHASNVTGAVHDVAAVVAVARRRSVPVLVDGAQTVPHLPTDVRALGCDYLAFSGHKMLGPSGIGVLYASEDGMARLTPTWLGGGTVDHVRRADFSLKRAPYCFEAGTPNIEGAIGLAAAVEYLTAAGMDRVAAHGAELAAIMVRELGDVPGLAVLGPGSRLPIVSLVPTVDVRVEALAALLSDSAAIMARAGTHCAHPYLAERGVAGTLRLSGYVYTSRDDVAAAAHALRRIMERLA